MAIEAPRSFRTVQNFGPSLLGSDSGNGPMMQVKQQWKYRILFENFGGPEGNGDPLTLNSNTVSFPTSTYASVAVHRYNSVSYYAGKHEFSTFEITVDDTVDNLVAKAIGRQRQRQMDHYLQTTYLSAQDYKFRVMIQDLTGGHEHAITNHFMEGVFIESVSDTSRDFTSSEKISFTLTLRPDNYIVEAEGPGGEKTVLIGPDADPYNLNLNI